VIAAPDLPSTAGKPLPQTPRFFPPRRRQFPWLIAPAPTWICNRHLRCGIEIAEDYLVGAIVSTQGVMDMTIATAPRVILGLHHVQISVPDSMEDAALQFYIEVLGLIPIDKPSAVKDRCGTWLQLGGLELHLDHRRWCEPPSHKIAVAYRVDDLAYWRNRMIENEVTPVESIPIPGYDRFEARDPFGNRIEFIQRIG